MACERGTGGGSEWEPGWGPWGCCPRKGRAGWRPWCSLRRCLPTLLDPGRGWPGWTRQLRERKRRPCQGRRRRRWWAPDQPARRGPVSLPLLVFVAAHRRLPLASAPSVGLAAESPTPRVLTTGTCRPSRPSASGPRRSARGSRGGDGATEDRRRGDSAPRRAVVGAGWASQAVRARAPRALPQPPRPAHAPSARAFPRALPRSAAPPVAPLPSPARARAARPQRPASVRVGERAEERKGNTGTGNGGAVFLGPGGPLPAHCLGGRPPHRRWGGARVGVEGAAVEAGAGAGRGGGPLDNKDAVPSPRPRPQPRWGAAIRRGIV